MKTPKLLDKLLADGELIRANTPLRDDLAFHHSLLCSIGLPRRPVLSREFLRRAGEGWLHVQAGALDLGDGPVPQPVPYGAVPRLALIWISTIARRSNSREIFIGRSASADSHTHLTLPTICCVPHSMSALYLYTISECLLSLLHL